VRGSVKSVRNAKRMRREMSLPEVLLWQHLRREQLAQHFQRQHPIGSYILDFYCSRAALAVEVDGATHDFVERALHDERRDAWLNGQGVRVMRIPASEILDDRSVDGILSMIRGALAGTAPSGD
jgi:very-short-patch-repair endonuclease